MRAGSLSREELSRLVRRLGKGGAAAEAGGEARKPAEVRRLRGVALSSAQKRLWFLDQLTPGVAAYNLPLPLRLRGALSAPALAAGLHEIVRRHEPLRARVSVEAGEPVQTAEDAGPTRLPVVDLCRLPAGRAEAEAAALAAAGARRPFDLSRDRFLRLALVRLAAEDHLLLAVFHHIAADGWSIGVFLGELAALYGAARSGLPPALPELPASYADFVAWEAERLAGPDLAADLRFWRRRLEGAPAVLPLPADRPAPATRRDRPGAHVTFAWPPELARALSGLARERGTTLFAVLLAGFHAQLARYSGHDAPVVGTPVANRPRRDLEPVIGMFVNTVPLRGDLADDPTFGELVARSAAGFLDAQEHAVPFERLVEELHPDRDLAHPPVVQVLFGLQNAPLAGGGLPGLETQLLAVGSGSAKVDLGLFLVERDGGLEGDLEFDRDLFDRTTARRLAGHLRSLLSAAAAAPETPVSRLPLLGAGERRQLLGEWNDTAAGDPRRAAIEELFAAQAARTPEAVAVVAGGRTLSYRELERRAEALARRLRAAGVGPETRVGLCVERSLALPVAHLAILQAGGAYVPLDPGYPAERLAFMLEDAGLPVLVGQEELLATLPPNDRPVVRLAASGRLEDGAAETAEAPRPGPAPGGGERLAYVMYTSGSTGRPNGVAVAHRGVVRLVRETRFAELGPDETFLQLAPVSFDAATLEIWGPLLNGGRLALFPPGTPSLAELGRTLAAERVTALWLTAGLFHQVVEEDPSALAGLRQLLAGGDVLAPGAVERVLREVPGRRMTNGYGPTENTTFTTCFGASPPAGDGRGRSPAPALRSIPIGRPIANTRVHVLDRGLEPVPIGVAGELWAAGEGLARGYWGRPRLTAERFGPHPWGERPGRRLYRTGDLVRWGAGGAIEFLGRIDQQVKIRGFRVEPGEVEASLTADRRVAAAVVVARRDAPGGGRLDAYVVAAEGAEEEAAGLGQELRSALAERLPGYLVPATITVLAELPLTPNGKVDRRALPDPDAVAEGAARAPFEPPRTPTEEALAGLWGELLGAERVGRGDDFFALGGHSLLATRLVSRIRTALGVDLPLRSLFEAPTVAGLAQSVEALRGDPDAVPAPPIRRRARAGPLPLSFAQERLWFLDRLEPGSSAYNIPAAFRLDGPLDLAVLAAALTAVVRRHEALRTTFETGPDGPRQVVGPPFSLAPPVVDLQRVPGAVTEEDGVDPRVDALAREEAKRPFDLELGPLVRAKVLRLAPRRHVILLTLHHVVADGWSIGIFVRELAAFYRTGSVARDGEAGLPELPVQYGDFALWQREWLAEGELERQVAYWRERLAGAPEVLELPTDRPRPSVITPRQGWRPVRVDPETTEGLRRLAREEGGTLFVVLLAAFDALLHRLTGQDDLVVGSPIANRNREEIEGLIGFFVNTLALRVDLSGSPTFRELVRRVRSVTAEAHGHQDLPFQKLVAELSPTRSRSHSPIFQVMLSVHDVGLVSIELSGLSLTPLDVAGLTAKYDLALALTETAEGLRGTFGYRPALFDPTTVERVGRRFDTLLRGVLADPDRPLRALPVLTPAEAHQVLVAFNETPALPPAAGPDHLLVHRLVAARAAAAPDAVALVLGDDQLSYGALAARADRLAGRLRGVGARPGERVAICLERSADQIVAVLAALETGAAYLPLDLAFPAERLAFMVADARPVALVTRGEHLELFAGLDAAERPASVLLDEGAEEVVAGPGVPPSPDDPAYVIYTSGSTGRPKGVVVSHRALAERLTAFRELLAFGPADRQLLFASLSFDLSCDELFLTLAGGASLVLEPRPAALRPLDVVDECARHRVTKLSSTSSHWHQLVEELAAAGRRLPPSLENLVTGGESPSAEKFAELARRAAPGARLYNFYGPTEATIAATGLHLPAEPERIARFDLVPIGRPFREARAHLADRELRPVPAGVTGEILLGGSGVAIGYLRRPMRTAERFVPDPWSPVPGARLYRSGDLARHRSGGEIEFLGRADAQVKVRGFRIELGEVEEALRQHPALGEAAAVVRSDGGDRRLVAYVVPVRSRSREPVPPPTVTELRAFLARRLPEFMVPSAFVTLEALPRTPTGKVDKKALPAPDGARPDLAGAFVAPETPLERFLAGVWREVLKLDRVGLRDGFFDLGGDSIQGATLIKRLEEALGEHVYVTALFDTGDLGELAAYLATQYPERVAELFGTESLPAAVREAVARPAPPVDEARLAELASLIRPLPRFPRESGGPNPPAVFVLSPPRSGSTLLRVMLAGHPRLFAPPELELLSFNTLGERRRAFSDRYAFWLEGVLRALMELHGCDLAEARRMMETRERADLPVRELYREIQEWIGDRVLVDKTPSYALDPAVLARAEEDFDEPRYLHLLRHPYGTVLSFEEARLEQLFFRHAHSFERRELAELIWTASHRNILAFLDGVPESRRHALRFEDLVREPEAAMRGVARFLGLEYTPAMIEPYEDGGRRMTDGVHAQSKMLGDVKFHRHRGIDASGADRWRRVYEEDFLGEPTRRLARSLGYADLAPAPALAVVPGGGAAPAVSRRRLPPCLTALRPGSSAPPLFLVHAVFGDTYFFRHLAGALAPGRPVYGLRASGMEAGEEPLDRVEAMAERYLESVVEIAPDGPYHLVGSSMGGLVAYEMARRLDAGGRRVGLLGFLDTGEPGEAPAAGGHGAFELDALDYLLGGADPDAVARVARIESRDERLAAILAAAQAAGALPATFGLDRLRRLRDVADANGRAARRYRPGAWNGDLAHYRAAATAGRLDRPDASGWSELCRGKVAVEIVAGDHMSLHFPPQVLRLAASLDRRMARAEAVPARERAAAIPRSR